MKKLLSFVLIIMLATCAACGGTSNQSSDPDPPSTDDSAAALNSTQDAKADAPVYSLTNAVIVSDGNCTFTVSNIDAQGLWGFTLNVLCENNTDKNLRFSWDNVSVNGYMIDPLWGKEIAAGKKANAEISFFDTQLEECNIASVDEIVFTLTVSDADDWLADNLVDMEYAIYPTGLDASCVAYPVRTTAADERTILDNENCTFIIESVVNDEIWGYTLNCYLENKSDEALMFSWNDVSVNGYMVDPFWAKEVAAGKRAFSDISFSTSDFEENGISAVNDIEFNLKVSYPNDWTASDVFNDVFTYHP